MCGARDANVGLGGVFPGLTRDWLGIDIRESALLPSRKPAIQPMSPLAFSRFTGTEQGAKSPQRTTVPTVRPHKY